MNTHLRLGLLVSLVLQVINPAGNVLASPTEYYVGHEFEQFYSNSGGLPIFGYAISERLLEENLVVQYFERQRLEHHPENAGTPYEVLLGHVGVNDAEQRGLMDHEAFQPQPSARSGDNSQFFPETSHNLSGQFRNYWHSHGLNFGDDGVSYRESLALFGYPISEEFVDPDSGRLTQYFERARFEYHEEYSGTEYEVLLGHLGYTVLGAFTQRPDGPPPLAPAVQIDERAEPGREHDSMSVMNTGARGDGDTDDTNAIRGAIQRAQSAGRSTVYLPPGTYMVRSGQFERADQMELIIPEGMSLVGAGRDQTTIKVIPDSIDSRPNQAAITMMSNTRVADLTLDGSKDQVDRTGISRLSFQGLRVDPWNSRNVTIENIRIHDIVGINAESFGTMLNGVGGARLNNIEAFNIDGSGIHIDGDYYRKNTSDVHLTNATVYDNGWAGVSVYGANDVIVEGVTAYNNGRGGLNVEWSQNVYFKDSHSHNNEIAGLVTNGWNENIQAVGMTMNDNQWSEVRIQENEYHAPRPGTYYVAWGVTTSMTVRDSTLEPRSGRPEFIIRTFDGSDDPHAIFTFSGAGSGDWTVWNEQN